MEGHFAPKDMAIKLLVVGIILILVRIYTRWDMWIVISVLLIIKAIIMLVMPNYFSHTKAPEKAPARRR